MRRTARGAVVVGLWLAALSPPLHAVRLRYAPEVGATHTYTTVMSGQVTVPMGGSSLVTEMSGGSTLDERVVEKVPTGVKVEVSSHDATTTVSVAGREEKTQSMPDFVTTLIIDPLGRVRKVASTGADENQGPLPTDFLSSLEDVSAFPEKEVQPNDTWKGTATIAASSTVPGMRLAFKSRLLELTSYRGRQCAKIRTSTRGTFSGTVATASVEGSLIAITIDYYDYEHSVWVDQETKATMTMTMEMSGEQADAMGPLDMKLKMTSLRTLSEPEA